MRFVNGNSLPLYAEETVAAGDGHSGVLHAGRNDSTPGIRQHSVGVLKDVRRNTARPTYVQVSAIERRIEQNQLQYGDDHRIVSNRVKTVVGAQHQSVHSGCAK